jgi:hypothetical protein
MTNEPIAYAAVATDASEACFGDYSPEKSTEEHEKQGVFDVMHIVAGYLASRAVKRIEGFEGLVEQIH